MRVCEPKPGRYPCLAPRSPHRPDLFPGGRSWFDLRLPPRAREERSLRAESWRVGAHAIHRAHGGRWVVGDSGGRVGQGRMRAGADSFRGTARAGGWLATGQTARQHVSSAAWGGIPRAHYEGGVLGVPDPCAQWAHGGQEREGAPMLPLSERVLQGAKRRARRPTPTPLCRAWTPRPVGRNLEHRRSGGGR